jgi:ankyrin repeat protein
MAMGGDANARRFDQPALWVAARQVGTENLMMLIRHGAEVTARSSRGRTALHGACEMGRIDMFQLLLASGADVGIRDADGRTPLHVLSGSPYLQVDAMVEAGVAQLLLGGADVNARDRSGSSPLHLATRAGNERVVRALLTAGADRSLRDAQGRMAIVLA